MVYRLANANFLHAFATSYIDDVDKIPLSVIYDSIKEPAV